MIGRLTFKPVASEQMLESWVAGAQLTERCAHLSAKSSMSKIAACRSECSWRKKTMMACGQYPAPMRRAADNASQASAAWAECGEDVCMSPRGNACDSRGVVRMSHTSLVLYSSRSGSALKRTAFSASFVAGDIRHASANASQPFLIEAKLAHFESADMQSRGSRAP